MPLRFSAIKQQGEKVSLTWDLSVQGDIEATGSIKGAEDPPAPEFTEALQAFVGDVVSLCEEPSGSEDQITVTKLSISRDKDGRTGLIITATKKVEGGSVTLNTPLRREPAEGSPAEHVLGDDLMVKIREAEEQATKYVQGHRQQRDMFDGEDEAA